MSKLPGLNEDELIKAEAESYNKYLLKREQKQLNYFELINCVSNEDIDRFKLILENIEIDNVYEMMRYFHFDTLKSLLSLLKDILKDVRQTRLEERIIK